MMKTASMSSVARSFGRRRRKRMTPSGAARAPATIARPSTSSAFARSEPTNEVPATTPSPAANAKSTRKSSGRFPSVDWSAPVIAGPKRCPTASVAIEITQASPASATPAAKNVMTGSASRKWRAPATSVATPTPANTALRLHKPHALVHRGDRRSRDLACFLSANSEEAPQFVRIRAQLLVAGLNRLEERDDGLADVSLELPVAGAVVARLDRLGRLAGRDGHDVDEVRDPRFVRGA